MNVSAIIVTRGDQDLAPCFATLSEAGITDLITWNNATADRDLSVYGRYEAISGAVGAAILVQDDDVILDVESVRLLIDAYTPGHVVCNMPTKFRSVRSYNDSGLVGFGAVFDRNLPDLAFARFLDAAPVWRRVDGFNPWTFEDLFNRECDSVFTMLTPRRFVDLAYSDREFASAPNRLWKRPEHRDERELMRRLVRQVRDAA